MSSKNLSKTKKMSNRLKSSKLDKIKLNYSVFTFSMFITWICHKIDLLIFLFFS